MAVLSIVFTIVALMITVIEPVPGSAQDERARIGSGGRSYYIEQAERERQRRLRWEQEEDEHRRRARERRQRFDEWLKQQSKDTAPLLQEDVPAAERR